MMLDEEIINKETKTKQILSNFEDIYLNCVICRVRI